MNDSETVFNENLGRMTALASESVLRSLWDTPEEDAAWQHLLKSTRRTAAHVATVSIESDPCMKEPK